MRREVWSAVRRRPPEPPCEPAASTARSAVRAGVVPRELAGRPRSSAPRPSAACCSSSPRPSRWSGRTRPWSAAYDDLRDLAVGPEALHLDLSLGTWAADGLLAIFFFVAGLELKREFVAGDLRDPRRAALPVAAAVGGMVVPALSTSLFNLGGSGDAARLGDPHRDRHRLRARGPRGDQHPPAVALRTFLLTLAVVDDLLAITVIAVFYTDDLRPASCSLARWCRSRCSRCWSTAPGAVGVAAAPARARAWALVHASGVHATVAGVLLAFTVPVAGARRGRPDRGLAEHLEHLVRPISAGLRRAGLRVLRRRRDRRRPRRAHATR